MIDSELVCQNPEKHCLSLAVTYCPTCDLCLCQDCEKATHQPKIMKSHQLVSMQNRVPKCQIHPQYPLDKICLQRKVLICAECQSLYYKDQDVQTLEQVASTIRTNLSDDFIIDQNMFSTVLDGHGNDALKHAKDVEDSGESLISEVDGIFETLHAKLTSRHEQIKEEIRSAIKAQVNQCAHIKEKVSTMRSNLTSVRQNFNKQLPSDFGLVTSSSSLEQALEDMREDIRIMIEEQSVFYSYKIAPLSEVPLIHETIASFCPLKRINMYEAHKEVQLLAINDIIDDHTNYSIGDITDDDFDGDEERANATMLEYERYSPLLNACKDNDDMKVKLLIDYGADIELKTDKLSTALICSSCYGHDKCVSLLLDAGAEKDAINNNGETALIWASYQGNDKCVSLLIDAGAETNIVDKDGLTALLSATKNGHIKCVELLLNTGNLTDEDRKMALDSTTNPKCLELLESSIDP
eukprot:CAMPEP_0114336568 /NCGR_PEP_ID=MMETSP0101-20121206/5796_1 /TAXON_ID=38822 ORGANISM="Pteridomonas danica, Strain PT" /NCGR_SAMPLE_ID=MMETSP0101 /ASSEMBLY_ACC=CAM_ASM_000211 /LENGTH=466 /DNA_ID=CAMNT_0001468539 /DNA_START=497 /DNA_END=1897 /DNA_ORIENTATION=-